MRKATTKHVLKFIQLEHDKAKKKYKQNFNSTHEGFAVLKEEVDELWDEVKRKYPSKEHMREEAIQVAAMCVRFINELT